MFVAVARLEYHVPHARSLKAKRHVVRKLIDKTRARFKVSVNEVDHQDLWQRTAIGVAVVGKDGDHVEHMLSEIMRFLDNQHLATPLGRLSEIIAFGEDDSARLGDLAGCEPGGGFAMGSDSLRSPDRDPPRHAEDGGEDHG